MFLSYINVIVDSRWFNMLRTETKYFYNSFARVIKEK